MNQLIRIGIIRIILNNLRKLDFLLLLIKVYRMAMKIIFPKIESMHHYLLYTIFVAANPECTLIIALNLNVYHILERCNQQNFILF